MSDDVKVELGDNKSKVAYDMATRIYFGENNDLTYENRKEFLDLVQECVAALRLGHRRG